MQCCDDDQISLHCSALSQQLSVFCLVVRRATTELWSLNSFYMVRKLRDRRHCSLIEFDRGKHNYLGTPFIIVLECGLERRWTLNRKRSEIHLCCITWPHIVCRSCCSPHLMCASASRDFPLLCSSKRNSGEAISFLLSTNILTDLFSNIMISIISVNVLLPPFQRLIS